MTDTVSKPTKASEEVSGCLRVGQSQLRNRLPHRQEVVGIRFGG